MNEGIPVLETDRLLLRLGVEQDIPEIIAYHRDNAEHLAPWQPTWTEAIYTHEYWAERITLGLEEFRQDKSLRLLVFFRESESWPLLGMVSLNNIVRGPIQDCNLGYGLAKGYEGNGYMREAVAAAINFAFQVMNLHRLSAGYQPHNRRSGELLKQLGFTVEGYARDFLYIDGKWQDHIQTSLINKNWKKT
jgi:ribosomal-protein-alanine N-acetyltransferase